MIPVVSQVSTLPSPWDHDVREYAAGACRAAEVWLTKLETFLESHSLDEARRLLDECEMRVPVASLQGGLLVSQGEARREAWDLFQRRLELCRALGIETLVVAADIRGGLDQQTLDRVQHSLTEAAGRAGRAGLRVALEFQAGAAFANNLQTAAALVAETGSPHLGLCLDTFHFYTGPSKLEDLAYLSPANLFHVQLCDLAGVARELATDADRVLPGDGDFRLDVLVAELRAMGYAGTVGVEVMNPQLWQTPPRQLAEIAVTALRRLLGQASMGG